MATFGLSVLDWPGQPRRSYELFCGLLVHARRIELRRGYVLLRAVKDALSDEIPADYFQALSADEEEAAALYNLHQSRVAWERRQAQQMTPEVDGGV